MRVVGIIQARLSSQRLQGKALLEIHGAPMLWHVVNRTRRAKTLDAVVVATSFAEADLQLVYWCQRADIPVYRGGVSEDDVLGRYYDTAINTGADVIVRICGDCPLIDPTEIDRVVKYLNVCGDNVAYVSNAQFSELPDGLDCEAMRQGALRRAHFHACLLSDREHVTPWIQRTQYCESVTVQPQGYGHLRFCVDDEQDLTFVRAVYEAMGRDDFGWRAVVKMLKQRPDVAALMGTAERNEGLRKSLANDHGFTQADDPVV